MNTTCGQEWLELTKVIVCVVGVVTVLWKIIDNTVKMKENTPDAKSNKVSARVKAAGCTAAFIFLQIPYAKSTLDFDFYGYPIQLYSMVNAGMLLAALYYGIVTGGTYLTNIKGNGTTHSNGH